MAVKAIKPVKPIKPVEAVKSVKEVLAGDAANDAPSGGSESPDGAMAEVAVCTGYLRITLPAGQVVTEPVATQAAREFERLSESGATPLLLDVTGVEAITRNARSVFASARTVSAVAVLGASQVDRVIANFLLGGELPECPTKYFSAAAEALQWLESQP